MRFNEAEDRLRRYAAADRLQTAGFRAVGGWIFEKNGTTYDLSAADLDHLERIERERLFVVGSD